MELAVRMLTKEKYFPAKSNYQQFFVVKDLEILARAVK
jgi:hypothetical protein